MIKHPSRAAWAAICLWAGLAHGPAQAELALRLGPADALHHFPSYLTDAQNQAVQLCLDGDGSTGPCLFDPAANAPTSPWAQSVGFGSEAAYSVARSTLVMPNGRRADLSVGLHAGYAPGTPADGAQQLVSRVGYRIQVPGPGLYVVFHPYLAYPACQPDVHTVNVGAPNVIQHVSERASAAPFRTLTGGDAGAILRWDPAVAPVAPAGYLGDPQVTHALVGSPCGVNSFRIEGPNIGGPGLNLAQTSAFRVAGKAYTAGPTQAALVVDRATYTRTAQATRVSLYGRADPGATVTLLPALALTSGLSVQADADGNFFIQVVAPPTVPGGLLLTTNPADPSNRQFVQVSERLDITSALYNAATRTLVVRVLSGEPAPIKGLTVLTGAGVGVPMTRVGTTSEFIATFTGVAVPPPMVSVVSIGRGGRATALVQD